MIKMCLNLRNSKFNSIEEVERIIAYKNWDIVEDEEKILAISNSRREINRLLKCNKQKEELLAFGL